MARERLLVAVFVPPPLDVEVDGLRRALGDRSLGRIGSHATLVPPVNVPDGGLDAAFDVVRAAAAATEPLRLRLGPAATFHPRNPVVYLAVGGPGAGGLDNLRERCLVPPLQRRSTHDFVPHVTVANRMAPERIPGAVAALADYEADIVIDRIHLLRMEPGNLWRPLADAPFAPPAVVGRGGLPLAVDTSDLLPPDAAALLSRAVPPAVSPAPGAGGGPWAVTARRDGAVAGAAAGWVAGGSWVVAGLAVAAGERRQGVGRHLVAAVEAAARARGCAVAEALVAATSGDVEALYAGAGWSPEGGDGGAERRDAPGVRLWRRWL
jgi:2'-5' RNA ligase/GNAT superfamily N-acetyltransferase